MSNDQGNGGRREPATSFQAARKRILVVVPFALDEEGIEKRRGQLAGRVDPSIHYEFRPVKAGPSWLDSYHDSLLADVAIFEAGLSAEEDGFDAVVIDTVSDSGVQALRSVLSIPVIGPGRAMYLTALMLGDRFSILTLWDGWKLVYRQVLRAYGLEGRCASVRSIGVSPDVRNLLTEKPEVPDLLRQAGEACIEDGAEVIVMGSTTMHEAVPRLQETLPVPVINPGPLSYKIAEACLDLGLSHAGPGYQPPRSPKPEMAHAMMAAAAEVAGAQS